MRLMIIYIFLALVPQILGTFPYGVITGVGKSYRIENKFNLSAANSIDTDTGAFSASLTFEWTFSSELSFKVGKELKWGNGTPLGPITTVQVDFPANSLEARDDPYYVKLSTTKGLFTDIKISFFQMTKEGPSVEIQGDGNPGVYESNVCMVQGANHDLNFVAIATPQDPEEDMSKIEYVWNIAPRVSKQLEYKNYLSIQAGDAVPQAYYTIFARVTDSSGTAPLTFSFYITPGLNCQIVYPFPDKGVGLNTSFYLSADNYQDFYTESLGQLEYRFSYRITGMLPYIFTTFVPWTLESTYTGRLPWGAIASESKVEIQIEGKNIYGDLAAASSPLNIRKPGYGYVDSESETEELQLEVESEEIDSYEYTTRGMLKDALLFNFNNKITALGITAAFLLKVDVSVEGDLCGCSVNGKCDPVTKVCTCNKDFYGLDCGYSHDDYLGIQRIVDNQLDLIELIVKDETWQVFMTEKGATILEMLARVLENQYIDLFPSNTRALEIVKNVVWFFEIEMLNSMKKLTGKEVHRPILVPLKTNVRNALFKCINNIIKGIRTSALISNPIGYQNGTLLGQSRALHNIVQKISLISMADALEGKSLSASEEYISWKAGKVRQANLMDYQVQTGDVMAAFPAIPILPDKNPIYDETETETGTGTIRRVLATESETEISTETETELTPLLTYTVVDWKIAPIWGHADASQTISSAMQLSLAYDQELSPLDIRFLPSPLIAILKVTNTSNFYNCSYFDAEDTRELSSKGLDLIEVNEENNTGSVACESRHLMGDFVISSKVVQGYMANSLQHHFEEPEKDKDYNMLESNAFWFSLCLTVFIIIVIAIIYRKEQKADFEENQRIKFLERILEKKRVKEEEDKTATKNILAAGALAGTKGGGIDAFGFTSKAGQFIKEEEDESGAATKVQKGKVIDWDDEEGSDQKGSEGSEKKPQVSPNPRRFSTKTVASVQDEEDTNFNAVVSAMASTKMDKKKKKKTSLCAAFFMASCCFIFIRCHNAINPFLIVDSKISQTSRLTLLYLEILFNMTLSGVFFSTSLKDSGMTLMYQIMISICVLAITLPFLLICALCFIKNDPPMEWFYEDGDLVEGMETEYAKWTIKQKRKIKLGYILAVIMAFISIFLVNFMSFLYGDDVTRAWMATFYLALFNDYFVIQPCKCFLIYACTNSDLLDVILELFIGGFFG